MGNLISPYRYYANADQGPYTGQQLPKGIYYDSYTHKYVRPARARKVLLIATAVINI